jgi:hypothetical protein
LGSRTALTPHTPSALLLLLLLLVLLKAEKVSTLLTTPVDRSTTATALCTHAGPSSLQICWSCPHEDREEGQEVRRSDRRR